MLICEVGTAQEFSGRAVVFLTVACTISEYRKSTDARRGEEEGVVEEVEESGWCYVCVTGSKTCVWDKL